VVIADVPPLATVVGVPAREVKHTSKTDDLSAWLIPQSLRQHLQPAGQP
jgi:serine acetyltransferase